MQHDHDEASNVRKNYYRSHDLNRLPSIFLERGYITIGGHRSVLKHNRSRTIVANQAKYLSIAKSSGNRQPPLHTSKNCEEPADVGFDQLRAFAIYLYIWLYVWAE